LPDNLVDIQPNGERRVHQRVRVRWSLSLLKKQGQTRVLTTVTENLSSQGFFCVVDERLAAGERVECILKFPLRTETNSPRSLRCEAEVIWVSVLDGGRFGIGCRIDDYTFVG
jgi:hypothetical protein